MANVINRVTKRLLLSVNTPDYSESEWIINPDLSAVNSIPQKFWKIEGDDVVEMSIEEKVALNESENLLLIQNELTSYEQGLEIINFFNVGSSSNVWLKKNSTIDSKTTPCIISNNCYLIGLNFSNNTDNVSTNLEIYKNGTTEDNIIKIFEIINSKSINLTHTTSKILFQKNDTLSVYCRKNGTTVPTNMLVNVIFKIIS